LALSDDAFIIEAPSFIVPYIYEKPPKESFLSFKDSVVELSVPSEKIEQNNNKESTTNPSGVYIIFF